MMVRKRHETNPETYAKYYLDQQSGNGTSKYVASHYRQRGYGIGSVLMSKLWNLAKPLIRSAAPVAASVGKKVISDVASGRSLKDATINRVREAGGGMIQQSKVNHARGRGGSSSKRGSRGSRGSRSSGSGRGRGGSGTRKRRARSPPDIF